MSTPHEYFDECNHPHNHCKGNSALYEDVDAIACGCDDQLPNVSTIGRGPRGDAYVPIIEKMDGGDTFIIKFVNDRTGEVEMVSPNLSAGYLTVDVTDAEGSEKGEKIMHVYEHQEGIQHLLSEIKLPEGIHGSRIFIHKYTTPLKVRIDMTYKIKVEDIMYTNTAMVEEQPKPRVWDIVLAYIMTPATEVEEAKGYFAAGCIYNVDDADDPYACEVVFRGLYDMHYTGGEVSLEDFNNEVRERIENDKQFKIDLQNEISARQAGITYLSNSKVDKEEGKGLSTNDFTDDDKFSIHTHDNKRLLDSLEVVADTDDTNHLVYHDEMLAEHKLASYEELQTEKQIRQEETSNLEITKQAKLTAGDGIFIDEDNVISSWQGIYTFNINLEDVEIEGKQYQVPTIETMSKIIDSVVFKYNEHKVTLIDGVTNRYTTLFSRIDHESNHRILAIGNGECLVIYSMDLSDRSMTRDIIVYANTADMAAKLALKQNKLTAGDNITITRDNIISAKNVATVIYEMEWDVVEDRGKNVVAPSISSMQDNWNKIWTDYNAGYIVLIGGEVQYFPVSYVYDDDGESAEYLILSTPEYDVFYKRDNMGLYTRRIAAKARMADLDLKQNKLTAGANIAITEAGGETIISATGSGSGWVNKEYVDTQDTAVVRACEQYTDNKLIDKQDKLIAGDYIYIDENNKIGVIRKDYVTIVSVDTETAEDETGTYEVTVPTISAISTNWNKIWTYHHDQGKLVRLGGEVEYFNVNYVGSDTSDYFTMEVDAGDFYIKYFKNKDTGVVTREIKWFSSLKDIPTKYLASVKKDTENKTITIKTHSGDATTFEYGNGDVSKAYVDDKDLFVYENAISYTDEKTKNKQDKLTAGDHITIVNNKINAVLPDYPDKEYIDTQDDATLTGAKDYTDKLEKGKVKTNTTNIKALQENMTAVFNDITNLQENKQDKLTAGDGIEIDDDNVISTDRPPKSYIDFQDGLVYEQTIDYIDAGLEKKQNTLIAGNNITLTPVGDKVEIAAGGGGGGLVEKDYVDSQDKAILKSSKSYTDNELEINLAKKQDKLKAGKNITIENNVISTYDFHEHKNKKTLDTILPDLYDAKYLDYMDGDGQYRRFAIDEDLETKQDKLTASDGIVIKKNKISIDEDILGSLHWHENKTLLDGLSVSDSNRLRWYDKDNEKIITGATYKDVSEETDARKADVNELNNKLMLKQDLLTAGDNITIDEDNVISASGCNPIDIEVEKTSKGTGIGEGHGYPILLLGDAKKIYEAMDTDHYPSRPVFVTHHYKKKQGDKVIATREARWNVIHINHATSQSAPDIVVYEVVLMSWDGFTSESQPSPFIKYTIEQWPEDEDDKEMEISFLEMGGSEEHEERITELEKTTTNLNKTITKLTDRISELEDDLEDTKTFYNNLIQNFLNKVYVGDKYTPTINEDGTITWGDSFEATKIPLANINVYGVNLDHWIKCHDSGTGNKMGDIIAQ